MVHILGCIVQQHDLRLVAIAIALSFFACSTALAMVARARAANIRSYRLGWLASAGVVAGFGVWATHFVGMLAFNIPIAVTLNAGLTALSALVAILFCGLGFALAINRPGGAMGGLLIGAAICAMHYIGMAALELRATAIWDIRYVAASVVIGPLFATMAMHLALRGRGYGDYISATALFVFAIAGMHFTAMSAVRFLPDPTVAASSSAIDPFALSFIVAAIAAFIISQGLLLAIFDYHLSARVGDETKRMRAHIIELEITKTALSHSLAAEAQASQAKSAFLASMSHELRTPLNAVIGFSEMMIAQIFGPIGPRYHGYAKDIHGSGTHLLSLINDVLDLSKLDAGQGELWEEEFDLSDLVSESLRLVSVQASDAGIVVGNTGQTDEHAIVKADKRRVKQILLNVLSNALKFTPSGGNVSIQLGVSPIAISIVIKDSGIGIAPADMSKVFERFAQVDSRLSRKYEGSGLGLPLARRFAELHGGSLSLTSALTLGLRLRSRCRAIGSCISTGNWRLHKVLNQGGACDVAVMAMTTAAKLHVLHLAPIKTKLGAKWPKLSELVHKVFEKAIRAAQGPRDHFILLDELSYIVTFHGLAIDEATLACAGVAQEVCEKLFGGIENGISIRSLVGQLSESILERHFPEIGRINAMLELNGRETIMGGDPIGMLVDATTTEHGANDLDWENISTIHKSRAVLLPLGLQIGFFPIWDLAKNTSSCLYASAHSTLVPQMGCTRRLLSGLSDRVPHAEIALLYAAHAYSQRVRNARKVCAVGTSVSFETLTVFSDRIRYITALKSLTLLAECPIMLKLEEIPVGIPLSKLAELISMLAIPNLRFSLKYASHLALPETIDIRLGAVGIGSALPPHCDAVLAGAITKKMIQAFSSQKGFVFVEELDSPAVVISVKANGGRFGIGHALGAIWNSGAGNIPAFPLQLNEVG